MSYTGDQYVPDMDLSVWQDDVTTNKVNHTPVLAKPQSAPILITSPTQTPTPQPVMQPTQPQNQQMLNSMVNIELGMKDVLILIIIVLTICYLKLYINYRSLKTAIEVDKK